MGACGMITYQVSKVSEVPPSAAVGRCLEKKKIVLARCARAGVTAWDFFVHMAQRAVNAVQPRAEGHERTTAVM